MESFMTRRDESLGGEGLGGEGLYARLWKQPRLLVLLRLLFDLGRPAQLKELVALTSGDDEAVSKCCSALAVLGLLTRTSVHMGWCLTPQGLAFIIPSPSPVETQDRLNLVPDASLYTSTGDRPVGLIPSPFQGEGQGEGQFSPPPVDNPVDNSVDNLPVIASEAACPERSEGKQSLPIPVKSPGKPVNSPQSPPDPHLSTASPQPGKNPLNPAQTVDQSPQFPVKSPLNPVNQPVNPVKRPVNPVNKPDPCLSYLLTQSKQGEDSKQETGKTGFLTENLKFFEEIGVVRNPKTTHLAQRIPPATVRLEWQKLLDKDKAWPGLLVKTLSSLPPPAHPRDCDCPACLAKRLERDRRLRQRYAEWEA
jgi:hypothetical protein